MSMAKQYRAAELNRIRREAVGLTASGQSFEQVVGFMREELRSVDQTLAALGTAMKIVDRASKEAIRRHKSM
jgi:hypothetical protein